MTPFEQTIAHITPLPTMLYGLKYFPSLEPHCSNDQDSPNWGWHAPDTEVTECNRLVVSNVLEQLGHGCQNILEIGVHRNAGPCISSVLMDNKPNTCRYLGVDINDKTHLQSIENRIYTIQSSSFDKVAVRGQLRSLSMNSIDVLMIDGWHSVHACINDWGYTDLLSPAGVVILHDTNAHPGCVALYDAVDEECFNKERFCTGMMDHGIAVFWHRA